MKMTQDRMEPTMIMKESLSRHETGKKRFPAESSWKRFALWIWHLHCSHNSASNRQKECRGKWCRFNPPACQNPPEPIRFCPRLNDTEADACSYAKKR